MAVLLPFLFKDLRAVCKFWRVRFVRLCSLNGPHPLHRHALLISGFGVPADFMQCRSQKLFTNCSRRVDKSFVPFVVQFRFFGFAVVLPEADASAVLCDLDMIDNTPSGFDSLDRPGDFPLLKSAFVSL
jgi:hypothetical protein